MTNWNERAGELAIWATGGINEFSGTREEVLEAWTNQIAKHLEAAYLTGVKVENEACAVLAEKMKLFGSDGDIKTSPYDVARKIRNHLKNREGKS